MLTNRFHRSWDGSALFGLALPVVTIALGLELLRLAFATAWAVYRQRLDGSLEGLAAIELGVLGLAFLAPLVYRALGPRRALWLTAGGVAVVRLAVQAVRGPSARLLLVLLGVALLLWFVPVYLRAAARTGVGRGFGPVVLAGLATDTALHGGWGTWDRAWTIGPWTVTVTAVLAAVVLLALARLPATVGRIEAGAAERDRSMAGARAVVAALPLVGLGAVLFLEVLLWQNLGRQAVMAGQPQHGVFLLVMVANALALVAAVAAAAGPGRVRPGWPPFSPAGWVVTGVAAAGVVLSVVVERPAPAAALLLGQVAAGVLVGRIGRWVAGRDGPGVGPASLAWGAGMLLFGMLVFAYYLVYERRLPYDNRWLPLVAAVVAAVAGAGAQLGLDRAAATGPVLPPSAAPARRRPVGAAWLPAVLGLALLGVPAVQRPVLAAAPPAQGCSVRVLSYNVHTGYGDDTGWMDLEGLAREIELTGAEVVGLQEVARGWYATGSADVAAWLARRLQIPYLVFGAAADPQFGNAILSRRPLLASGVVPLGGSPQGRSYLWAEIPGCRGHAMRLMVTHLHPPAGQRGSAVRVEQVRDLLQGWGRRPATVLLGDLNAVPASPEMRLLAQAGLRDAWPLTGGGPIAPPTHPSGEPDDRVDYLWLSPDLRASRFTTTHGIVSDHRGIAVTVEGSPGP